MSPRKPKNVIAVTPGGDMTLDHIVGWYAVSSIPDAGVSSTKLRRQWIAAGLNPDLIPKNRKAVHAFQVACRSVESRRQAIGQDNLRTAETRVDEVLENPDKCVYQVTRMIRDKDAETILHQAAMKVTFDKAAEAITSEIIDTADAAHLEGLTEAIQAHFDDNAKKIPGAKVRAAIRDELEDVNSTTIARKLYFVPKGPGREAIESLTQIVTDLYGDAGEFHTIPVASDEGQKKIIAKHFGLNVREQANRLLGEISERLRDGDPSVRSDKLKNMLDERREIIRQVEKYKDLLDMSLSDVDASVDLLNEGLEDLMVKTGSTAG